jgi:hypothetical protein
MTTLEIIEMLARMTTPTDNAKNAEEAAEIMADLDDETLCDAASTLYRLIEEARKVNSAKWAIVYNTNSRSPRAKRWYHVARVVEVDGMLFQVYWHDSLNTRKENLKLVKESARHLGLDLLPGVYCDAPSPRIGCVIVRADQRR